VEFLSKKVARRVADQLNNTQGEFHGPHLTPAVIGPYFFPGSGTSPRPPGQGFGSAYILRIRIQGLKYLLIWIRIQAQQHKNAIPDPDPGSSKNADPMRIRIWIRNPARGTYHHTDSPVNKMLILHY